jgi:type IV secretory pathway VirB2 component (pilin)
MSSREVVKSQVSKNSTTSTQNSSACPRMSKAFVRTLFLVLALAAAAAAQAGFATTEITNPIRNLVTIANAAIAGLAILAVIFYAIRWIGGDEGAAKRIIGVIVVAVIALGAANFLGFITGKAEFDTFSD